VTPALELVGAERSGDAWRTTWRLRSDDGRERTLVSVHAPHARFRSDPLEVGRAFREEISFALAIRTETAPGPLDTNPFLIVVVRDAEATWRLLYRLSVSVGADGTPDVTVGPVTTQRVT